MACAGAESKKPKRHLFVAALFFSAYVLMGINFASLGALLPELRVQANVSLDDAGAVFGARGGGYMFGALVSALLVDRLRGFTNLYFAFGVTMAGVATACLPVALTLIGQCACIFFIGTAMGMLDTGANAVLCWEFYGVDVKVDPFLQLMHSGFALGSFLAPIFMRYIAEADTHRTAFFALAGLYIAVPFAFIAMGKTVPRKDVKPDLTGATTLERQVSKRMRTRRVRLEWALVIVCSIVISFYLGLESGGGGFLLTYASEFVKLSGEELLWINAALWGSFLVGRVIAIAVATRTRPFLVLALAPLLTIISMLVPIIFGHTSATTWVATILFGLSMAPIFPTVFAYVEVNMHLSAQHSAAIVVGGAVGDIGLPLIMSEVFGAFTLITYPMQLVAIAVIMTLAVFVSVVFARKLHTGTRFGATRVEHKEILRELERAPSERLRNGPLNGSTRSAGGSLNSSTSDLNQLNRSTDKAPAPMVRSVSIPGDGFKDAVAGGDGDEAPAPPTTASPVQRKKRRRGQK